MSKPLYWFCKLVLYLDLLPRYGRVYTWKDGWLTGPQWMYMRRGCWGSHLLDRLGLLWPFIDHCHPDLGEWIARELENKLLEGFNEEN